MCVCCVYSLPPSAKALPDCQHYPAVFMEVWLNPVPTASRHDLILHHFSHSSQPPSIYRLQHFPLFFCLLSSFLWFLSLSLVYCCLPLSSTSSFSVPFFPFFFFFGFLSTPPPTPTVYPPLLSLDLFCFSCHQLFFFLFSCLSKETSWENKKTTLTKEHRVYSYIHCFLFRYTGC